MVLCSPARASVVLVDHLQGAERAGGPGHRRQSSRGHAGVQSAVASGECQRSAAAALALGR